MYILAFETSCDDTSVALFQDTTCIALSTRTQIEHEITWGVVPEVAARLHANAIFPCIEDVVRDAGIWLDWIDYIACTKQPGLLPSLLTGMTVAKTLANSLDKPLIWVDHIEWHIFANLLERSEREIPFPSIVLTVSGGHNELYIWRSLFDMEKIWETLDDAAWEAFDKVAKMLGYWFPGGPIIAKLAQSETTGYEWLFPIVTLEKDSLNFSFSWLKTAVKREIDKKIYSDSKIAFEFEEAVIRTLVKKLLLAAEKHNIKTICLAGWVSANKKLKDCISQEAEKRDIQFISPKKPVYSQDNAAMIGIRAYYEIVSGRVNN